MIEVKKNENESPINLIRRFKNKVRQANVLSTVKSRRFNKRAISKTTKKKNTLKKLEKIKKTEYLKRLGKI